MLLYYSKKVSSHSTKRFYLNMQPIHVWREQVHKHVSKRIQVNLWNLTGHDQGQPWFINLNYWFPPLNESLNHDFPFCSLYLIFYPNLHFSEIFGPVSKIFLGFWVQGCSPRCSGSVSHMVNAPLEIHPDQRPWPLMWTAKRKMSQMNLTKYLFDIWMCIYTHTFDKRKWLYIYRYIFIELFPKCTCIQRLVKKMNWCSKPHPIPFPAWRKSSSAAA